MVLVVQSGNVCLLLMQRSWKARFFGTESLEIQDRLVCIYSAVYLIGDEHIKMLSNQYKCLITEF